MPILKKAKDTFIKFFSGNNVVPRGLVEFQQYFRHYNSINFNYDTKDGNIVAISTDFRYGTIITSGKNQEELDKNIKDAILTSFSIPSSYANEAPLYKTGEKKKEYAAA